VYGGWLRAPAAVRHVMSNNDVGHVLDRDDSAALSLLFYLIAVAARGLYSRIHLFLGLV